MMISPLYNHEILLIIVNAAGDALLPLKEIRFTDHSILWRYMGSGSDEIEENGLTISKSGFYHKVRLLMETEAKRLEKQTHRS